MCAHAKFIAFGGTEGIGCVPIYCFWLAGRHWVCAHAKFIAFGGTEGIGCVPMQNLLPLAELKALGVCPCKIYCFWQNQRHWVCAHAKFIAFGWPEGIGCVPMQNLLLFAELNALGALCAQGPAWGPGCVVGPVAAHAVWRGQRQCGEGGRGFAERCTGCCTCCGIVPLWPGRDRGQLPPAGGGTWR